MDIFTLATTPRPDRVLMQRLEPNDRIVIDGHPFSPRKINEDGWSFNHDEIAGRELFVTHADFAAKLKSGAAKLQRDYHNPEVQKLRETFGDRTIDELGDEYKRIALYRFHLIRCYEDEERDGAKLPRTEGKFEVHLKRWTESFCQKAKRGGHEVSNFDPPTVRSFNEHYLQFRKCSRQLLSLAPQYPNSGRRGPRIELASLNFAVQQARSLYMNGLKHDYAQCLTAYQAALSKENMCRPKDQKLQEVKRSKFEEIIKGFSPFDVDAARHNERAAIDRFSPNQRLFETQRAGEHVQWDLWTGDVITLFAVGGILDKIPADYAKAFEKLRLTICAAICTTTRYVPGLAFSLSATGDAAVECAKRVVTDKRHIGIAAGALTPWIGFVRPETGSTDNGSEFKSDKFHRAMRTLGVQFTKPPKRRPKDRPFIESLFSTTAPDLLRFFEGRTFNSIAEKGGYKADEFASVAAEEFGRLFTLGIVDIYHNKIHSALGTSPHVAWQISTSNWPIDFHLSREDELRAFGVVRKGTLQRYGLVWMGIPYHSPELASEFLVTNQTEFEYYYYPDKVHSLLVKGHQGWFLVGNTVGIDETVDLQEWVGARKYIRESGKEMAADGQAAMFEAINKLRETGESARVRAKLSPLAPTEADYDRWDREYFGGWVSNQSTLAPALSRVFALPDDPLRRGTVAQVLETSRMLPEIPVEKPPEMPRPRKSKLDYHQED